MVMHEKSLVFEPFSLASKLEFEWFLTLYRWPLEHLLFVTELAKIIEPTINIMNDAEMEMFRRCFFIIDLFF